MATKKSGNTRGKANGPAEPAGGKAEEANQPAKAEAPAEIGAIDALQLVLDLAGMIPGAGAVPDLINAVISLLRGTSWARCSASGQRCRPLATRQARPRS